MSSGDLRPLTPLRVVDARFALPTLPRTAAVIGRLESWRVGFDAAGVGDAAPEVADVVVAEVGSAATALSFGRPTIVVGGRMPPITSEPVRRLKALPNGSPRVLLDLDHPVAAAHAVARLLPTSGRRAEVRNRAVATLLRRLPRVVPIRPDVTLVLRSDRDPAMVAALRTAGGQGLTPWCLALSSGRTERKCAYFLFGAGDEPDRVLKFKRLPGGDAHFDAVAAGLDRARVAGGAVARTAPRLLGRGMVQGHPLLLESAVRGIPLQRLLIAAGSERHKLELADRVAAWTIEVGAETARRDPVHGHVAFEHGDLWEENVVVDGRSFSLVDWEESCEAGTPLWDLVYFGVHALPLLGGARDDDERLDAALALARGAHPLSHALRRWMRDYVAAVGLAPDEVGPLIAARWRRWLDEYHSAPPEAAGWFVPRLGRAWLAARDLGDAWRSWR